MVQLPDGFLHKTVKASPGATSHATERNISLLAVKVGLGKRYNESIGIMRDDVDKYKFVFPPVPFQGGQL